MFNFFKKNKNQFPPFELLEKSEFKNKYFVRTKSWGWLNESMIHIFDAKDGKPRMVTMDPWPQQLYIDADGQKTVKEYVLWMASKYSKNNIPDELDQTILSVLSDLINDNGLVELKDNKTTLALDIAQPVSLK